MRQLREEPADESSLLCDAFAPRRGSARSARPRRSSRTWDGELFGDREPVLLGSEQAHAAEPDRGDDAEHEQAAKDGDAPHDVGDGIGEQTDDRVARNQAGGKGDGEAKPQRPARM